MGQPNCTRIKVQTDCATVSLVEAAQPFEDRFATRSCPVKANRHLGRMFFGHPASLFSSMYQKWYIV